MMENKKVESKKLNTTIEKKNEQTLETKLHNLSEEILKIQNSFSNLLAHDEKIEKQLENITNQKSDTLDNEIWVTNRIEEAKQETEDLIYEKIKKLNYEKTIHDLNSNIEKLYKHIDQVSYNKDRALEDLEDNLSIKIEDAKVIEDNILEDRIIYITEETIKNLKKDIVFLEKKVDKEIKKLFKEIEDAQQNKFETFAKEVNDKLQKDIDKRIEEKKERIDIEKQEEKFRKKIEAQLDITDNSNNISNNSVTSAYSNIKHVNHVKDLLIENNIAILGEVSKYDKKVTGLINELNTLKNNISKIQLATTKDIKELENKLNDNILNASEKAKVETNKAVENLIQRIEATKKVSEEQQKVLKEILDKKLKESETKNKELITQKIKELNIDKIKNNITKLEELTNQKLNELSISFGDKLKESEIKTQQLIIKEISNLEIENLKNELKKIEDLTSKKVLEIENILNNKIQEEKIENEKLISKAIAEVKENVDNLEKSSAEKIHDLEQFLTNKIDEEKNKNEKQILKAIEELHIDEIKNNINKLEKLSAEKIQQIENTINEKIDDLNYFDTIRDLKNSIQELKESALNTEYTTKAITKKINELDSINEKKLDKVRKGQEKFIIEKISELNTTEEIDKIKVSLEEISDKVFEVENLIHETQEKNFLEMQDYIEKRILRMKYATTIQLLTKEINGLKKKIKLLEESKNNEFTKEDMETILEQKLNEQKSTLAKNFNAIMQKKLKEQENKFMDNMEAIVEEKVKRTLKQIANKQKDKKVSVKKQVEYINDISIPNKNSNTKQLPSMSRSNNEIIDSIYNTRKSNTKKTPTSLDDMVATLSNLPNTKSKNKVTKTMNTLSKAVKKSQILNYDN